MLSTSTDIASSLPLVSVTITTFNLEKWLPRALDSVLEQRVDFPIEILISDDCSHDGTLNVARAYQEKHPAIIRVFERSSNVGVQRNTYEILEQCRGAYVAVLDGDDYWTNPEKLAIQVATLQADATLSVCGHFVRWVSRTGEVTRDRFPSIAPGRYGLGDILRHNFLATPSIMFRSGVHRQLPSWYFDFESLSDWPLWVLSASSGDILLLNDVMADVMQSPKSSFMSKGPLFWYQMDIEFYEQIGSVLPNRWNRTIRAEMGKRYESMSYLLRKQGDFRASRLAALRAFRSPFLMDNLRSKIKTLIAALVREVEGRRSGRDAGT
ncbi:MAG: glycosyltransferase [Acidobacteriota bacterium]|nr:glycosyltransferase [Acidobacteriota bacterium]